MRKVLKKKYEKKKKLNDDVRVFEKFKYQEKSAVNFNDYLKKRKR